VASYGNDGNPGTKESPVATVKQALLNLKNNYATYWPEKGTELENPGAIIILDEVTVTEPIDINGSVRYPPIILCDDPETSGGILQATNPAKRLYGSIVAISGGAKVTLSGGLVLSGTGDVTDKIRGVYIAYSSTFTMNGGTISDCYSDYPHSSIGNGGGVCVRYDSTFIMNGGTISDCYVSNQPGGGVFVYADCTFIMNGGTISGNSSGASAYGGGVFIQCGTFILNDGEISGNNSSEFGGGVAVGGLAGGRDAIFTMNNGTISGNSTRWGGGGVAVGSYAIFTMNGGEIWGNTAQHGGGVKLMRLDSSFAKTGGTIYGYDSGSPDDQKNNVVNSWGHAVYIAGTHRKETTVGPGDILYYNYPDTPDSGW
jgi:hypothetical protein